MPHAPSMTNPANSPETSDQSESSSPQPSPRSHANDGLPGDQYTSDSIQVLEGLEAIRKRPGMYVGGTGLNALHHLVYECVDNSIDEVMAGHATTVTVRIGVDGSCTVIDDGRGMPVDPMKHPNPQINGRPAVEVILTEVHAGGKFGGDNAYKVSGGLHGVGVKCVNALSEWTEVEVWRDLKTHLITFARGKVTAPCTSSANCRRAKARPARASPSSPTARSSPTRSSAGKRSSTASASSRTSTRASRSG
jgi:DNA gyrase/topoisomerase IV subunit B